MIDKLTNKLLLFFAGCSVEFDVFVDHNFDQARIFQVDQQNGAGRRQWRQ